MVQVFGLLFMVPAIIVNVETGMASGRSYGELTAAVAMVIGAGIAGVILGRALRDKAYGAALVSALVLVALTAMNIVNALGLASHGRSERRSEAGAAIAKVRLLEDRKRTLEDMIQARSAISSGLSSAKLQADVDAKRLQPAYGRSKQCSDVTLDDSRAFCGDLFRLQAMQSAALDVEKAQADLARVVSDLGSTEKLPESLDAQADNLIAFLPWQADAKLVGLVINGWWALCIELMASLMPGLVAFLARPAHLQNSGEVGVVNSPPQKLQRPDVPNVGYAPKRAAPKLAASLASFMDQLTKRTSDLTAAELMAGYCRHCEELGVTPESQRALGMAMTAAGYAKETKGNVRYLGVGLKASRPALKAVQ